MQLLVKVTSINIDACMHVAIKLCLYVTTLDYEAIEEYVDMDETLQNRTETQKLGESY